MTCLSSLWAPGRRGSRRRALSRGSASVRLCSSATPRSAPAGPSVTTAFGSTRSGASPDWRTIHYRVSLGATSRRTSSPAICATTWCGSGSTSASKRTCRASAATGMSGSSRRRLSRSALLSSSSPPGSTTRRLSRSGPAGRPFAARSSTRAHTAPARTTRASVCWSPASGTPVQRSRPTSWNRARIGWPSRSEPRLQ